MTFSKEFKEAISHLTSIEKDKLILRLLKKDVRLANRLLYDLLSDLSVDEMRDEAQKKITDFINISVKNFVSPKYLLADIRQISGIINEHVYTTLDKFGDVYLNIWMLNDILKKAEQQLSHFPTYDIQKLYITVIARIFKVMILSLKLHEDYHSELREEFQIMANYIIEKPYFMKTAINHGLDINWLLTGNIPENLVDIHKKIRENGFLR